jgi:Uma2 family endonuclease
MLELQFRSGEILHSLNGPYTLRIHGATEELFNDIVDEDTKAELIDGDLIVHSPASPRHNDIAEFLRALILCFAQETKQGRVFGPDCLIRFSTARRFAPDGFFLKRQHIPDPLPQEYYETVPDLVFEVLSPSNWREDLHGKRPAYQEAGVKEIWFVDPEAEEVIADRRRGQAYTTRHLSRGKLTSIALKGFWIDVAWLWEQPMAEVLPCLRQIIKQ